MLALITKPFEAALHLFKQKEELAERQELHIYAPNSLLFPFRGYSGGHRHLVFDLFAGLIERDQEGLFRGDLAESWTASPDKTVWRFTLRPEAHWSNGEPLVAEDFVRSITFLFKHKLLAPARWDRVQHSFPLQHLDAVIDGKLSADKLGVSADDEHVVCFCFVCPIDEALLLSALDDLAFYPIHKSYLDEKNVEFLMRSDIQSIQETTLITTGPFVISKKKVKNGVLFEKNPFYWNHRKVLLDRIVYTFSLPDNLNRIDIFQFHFAYLRDFPLWLKQFRPNLHIITSYSPFLMFFNLNDPLLSSKNVRKAIQYLLLFEKNDYFPYLSLNAFFSKALLKVIQFEKGSNPLLSLSVEQRIRLAQDLLTKEGFSDENPLTLNISHVETYSRLTFRDMITEKFKPIPFINVRFQYLAREELGEKVKIARQFQLFADRWSMPIESPLTTFLTQMGKQTSHITGFEQERFTEICRQLLNDPDTERQGKAYKELFDILYEEVPYLNLGYFATALYHQSHVGGIKGKSPHKQTLVTLPQNKTLYCLTQRAPRSRQKQHAFEEMLNDIVRCPY